MNLFTNAGDAMPTGGVLKIDALRNGQAAIVRVSDSGEGMDPETRKRCFDPFFTTKEVGKGTGLGLSTTYGIIKSHNGDVAVVSSSPRGSTFEISLPLADSDSDARKKAIIMGAGQAILVIENASDPNTTTSDLLECLGYRSARVMSVIEAMNKYENLRPDVVLIDASELSEDSIIQLRSITDNNPNAKIVALTDSSAMTPEHSDNGLNGIVKGYLQKPIDLSEASLLISEVLAC